MTSRRADSPLDPLILAWVLAVPAVYESARFNQLGFVVLALVLLGARCVVQRRPLVGGTVIAGAIVLKLLPGFFVLWLLLKREWRALAMTGAAIVILALLPCLIVFGARPTLTYHEQWWRHNVAGAPLRGMTDASLRDHFIDHRNQSVPAVLARLTDPQHPFAAPWQPVELHRDAARRVGVAVLGGLVLGLIVATRRPLPREDARRRWAAFIDVALYCLAMLLLSPLLRTYYLVWAVPALVVLAHAAVGLRGARAAGWAGLVVWVAGMAAWTSETARQYGVHVVMLIVIGALTMRVAKHGTERTS